MLDTTQILNETASILRAGGIILYPTDTIWALGCDATNYKAVEKIYDIKKRNEAKSLILLASDVDMIARYIKEIPAIALDLLDTNDRPMSIIYPNALVGVPNENLLAGNTVAQDGSIGIRIPMMAFCRELVKKLSRPLVSTSANLSGDVAPKKFSDISKEIKDKVDYIVAPELEKGSTGLASQIIKVGIDSTVEIIRA